MNAALLLEHYARIADAPDAVQRLRRFVLDLAIRGRLIEQDADDEPASALLTRSRGKVLKGRKASVQGSMADAPYSLPSAWEWVPVSAVFEYDAGRKVEPKSLRPDAWLLELEDIEKGTGRLVNRTLVSDRTSLSTKSEFAKGDILYGKLRPYLNKVIVADEGGYSTTEIVALRPLVAACPSYCALAFRRPDFVEYVSRLGQGTKMPRLRTEDALIAPFPLPPLAEQHRIVAKVEELMALCDQLETARAEREGARDAFSRSTWAKLSAQGPDTFGGFACFALANLAPLTTRPDQISQLRQAILNLAVRGKLVEQDASDEPAEMLLERTSADIERFCSVNRVARAKPEPLTEGAVPFGAPIGWSWVRLCQLFRVITDGDHQPPPRAESGVAFLTIGNVTTGRLDFSDCRLVPESYFRALPAYRTPAKGDILYTVVGATFGRPALVESEREFCVQRHIAILKPAATISLRFLLLLLRSPLVYDQAASSTTGTAQPTIALRPLRNFVVPVPPLAEQHRIVAKVDALMGLCDELEASIDMSERNRTRLLDALLYEALQQTSGQDSSVQV